MIHEPELLEEILIHLPAKSVARFRCVSKSWNSLLSQPQFIRTNHRLLHGINQYPIQEQSLILASDHSFSLFSVNLKSTHQVFDEMPKPPPLQPTELNLTGDTHHHHHRFTHTQILDKLTSCDGLIVVEDTNRNLLLINPATREFKQLQTPSIPIGWNMKYGIGYDSSSDDYKVVTITYKTGLFWDWRGSGDLDGCGRVNVYSVKNGTWKLLDDTSPHYHGDSHCVGGVYYNGNLHWIARNACDWWNVIVAFDLEKEEFEELPIPEWVEDKNLEYWEERCDDEDIDLTYAHFVIVDGCLCLAPSWKGGYEYVCYLMREYDVEDSWIQITIVDHDMRGVRPLCFLGEEQMVLLMGEGGPREKLVMYSLKEGTFKDVVIQGFPDQLAIKGTFVPSLLSPSPYKD